jgi:hypothetical protein
MTSAYRGQRSGTADQIRNGLATEPGLELLNQKGAVLGVAKPKQAVAESGKLNFVDQLRLIMRGQCV